MKKFHVQVSSTVLTKTKETAEACLRNKTSDAVQRQATKGTWSISGLNVVRVINEPNTAVITYEMDKEGDGNCSVLIYRVLGDSVDVSSLTIEDDIREVKAKNMDVIPASYPSESDPVPTGTSH